MDNPTTGTMTTTTKMPRPGFALSLQTEGNRSPEDAPVLYLGVTREEVIRKYAESGSWRTGEPDDEVVIAEVHAALAAGEYEAALAGMDNFHRGWYRIDIQPVLLPPSEGPADA